MSYTATMQITMRAGGIELAGVAERSADGLIAKSVALPAGSSGTLSTRTDANTGVCSVTAGHGLQSLDVVDVHWAGGCRYGMTATVATNDISVDGGAGDDLPAEDTVVVVTKQVTITAQFDGDDVEAVGILCDQGAHANFQDAGTASLFAQGLTAGEAWAFVSGAGVANPLTGNAVAAIKASNATTTAATLQLLVVHDSTP